MGQTITRGPQKTPTSPRTAGRREGHASSLLLFSLLLLLLSIHLHTARANSCYPPAVSQVEGCPVDVISPRKGTDEWQVITLKATAGTITAGAYKIRWDGQYETGCQSFTQDGNGLKSQITGLGAGGNTLNGKISTIVKTTVTSDPAEITYTIKWDGGATLGDPQELEIFEVGADGACTNFGGSQAGGGAKYTVTIDTTGPWQGTTTQCPTAGGTTITVRGSYLGQTPSWIHVAVGGEPCEITEYDAHQQEIWIKNSGGSITQGQYKLTYDGQTTSCLDFDNDASDIIAALEGLSNVPTDGVDTASRSDLANSNFKITINWLHLSLMPEPKLLTVTDSGSNGCDAWSGGSGHAVVITAKNSVGYVKCTLPPGSGRAVPVEFQLYDESDFQTVDGDLCGWPCVQKGRIDYAPPIVHQISGCDACPCGFDDDRLIKVKLEGGGAYPNDYFNYRGYHKLRLKVQNKGGGGLEAITGGSYKIKESKTNQLTTCISWDATAVSNKIVFLMVWNIYDL